MAIPEDIKEFHIPTYLLKTTYFIGFFRNIINVLCPYIGFLRDMINVLCFYIGLPSFLDHETSQHEPTRQVLPLTVSLADYISPVVCFSDLLRTDVEDCCTVCLSEFVPEDKVRQLPNCRHVFHRSCVDGWIVDCQKMTCPICRDWFGPDDCTAFLLD